MIDRYGEQGGGGPQESGTIVVRRGRGRRIAAYAGLAVLILLIIAIAVIWSARRPIASGYMEREFERRGVQADYHLDRVGLRTQQVSNLRIGDPRRPDLTAKFAEIQMRIKWNGTVEVYRIAARGVRLRGRFVKGKVSWGQIDKLLPPPSGKPFQLPNFVLDVADSSIALATPYGPLGIALDGAGNLTGGFKGRVALASSRLIPGKCQASDIKANFAVAVTARRPQVEGPLQVSRFVCPQSRMEIVQPRFDVNSRFNESFTNFDGRGRMAIQTLVAGDNGLANFVGDLTFRGNPENVLGAVKLSAQRSRLATIYADRTRLDGRYRLGFTKGTFVMVGDYAANSATLDPSQLASLTGALAALRKTPIGPVTTAMGNAISRTARNFDALGEIRMVNFPGGGAVRVESADVRGRSGARVLVGGGDGVTYYWPTGRLRVDGQIRMGGGGLPTGRIALTQPRNGAPMRGIAEFAPYTARGTRLALAPVRFAATRDGSTQISTIAQLDGPFPDGRVRALRLPISARLGSNGGFAVGTGCFVASFAYLQTGALQLGPTRLPVCPIGGAILRQAPGGSPQIGARFAGPSLRGRLGNSPLRLNASGGIIQDKKFAISDLAMRLGKDASPILFDAKRLGGTFVGSGLNGTFSGARSTIGNVPLAMSDISGTWRAFKGDVHAAGSMLVSDRSANPRFYPLRSDDVRFALADGFVKANGTLKHPPSGTRITDVTISHALDSGKGHALLDVPGITFGPNLQPEEITRLTEGVIALVSGAVSGRGRIDWSGSGNVTSTGDFQTANMDLAAPFGPVTGLSTSVHFDDLLALKTAPGQVASIKAINPGILVENGVIRYQLLPNQLVKVERGEWPFMGGRLILRETMLNFARPTAKRLTFEVVGFDAKQFVDSFGFEGLEITGKFDGVLPMIFDENGGRIVGGRLDSRPPGGTFKYTGTRPKAGLTAGVAFDLLSSLNYQNMIIRLDGDLAGEFATRFSISEIALGTEGGGIASRMVRRAFRNVPLIVNLNISGPFRALIQTAKGFKDPTAIIAPVMPFPLDVPGVVTETRTLRKEEDQTQTSPPAEKVRATTQPPTGSEK